MTHIVAPLEFSLQSTNGGIATAADFRGKVTMMYFGYTHCPDICPTTLAKLVDVVHQMGPQAEDVRVLFVTMDPARDTIPVLRAYVDAFDAVHFVGLRGDAKETAGIARRYRVGYTLSKPDASGNYEVGHSTAVFIFDTNGNARLLGTETTPSADYVADIKRLLPR
ncbi:MAG: SCO family protein [Stenotrophobium sp.]